MKEQPPICPYEGCHHPDHGYWRHYHQNETRKCPKCGRSYVLTYRTITVFTTTPAADAQEKP